MTTINIVRNIAVSAVSVALFVVALNLIGLTTDNHSLVGAQLIMWKSAIYFISALCVAVAATIQSALIIKNVESLGEN